MTTVLLKLQSWALTALAVLAVLVGAYGYGHRKATASAKKDADLNKATRAAAGAQGVKDAQVHVDALPAGAADAELRRDWMRPDEPDTASGAAGLLRDGFSDPDRK